MKIINQEEEGTVFNIERYSNEDGPGIRTVVFLKGCPLRCDWCSNPESQSERSEILYLYNKCVSCGRCIMLCPQNAISLKEEFGLITDPNKCDVCGICTDACYYSAREVSGKRMTVSEVLEIVRKDKMYYSVSGGGVTISGGEPLLQPNFLKALAGCLTEEGIHTAVETTLFASKETVLWTLESIDLVYVDLKHMDQSIHQFFTGIGNGYILDNIRLLDELNKPFIIRVPFITGFNNDDETQKKIYEWAATLNNMQWVEVLPYHRLGEYKYKGLGRDYKLKDLIPVKKDSLRYLTEMGSEFGIKVKIGAS